MSEPRAGMHDNPAIYPTLPAKEPDDFARWVLESDQGAFQTCWEYVLTHDLSQSEGAAFWTAANLVHAAMTTEAPVAAWAPDRHTEEPNDE